MPQPTLPGATPGSPPFGSRSAGIAATLLALGLLAGCSNHTPLTPGFGNAVAQNLAVQVVEPLPAPEPGSVDHSGRRAADAVERYEAGQVKPPRPVRTAIIGGGASGAGNAGGGGGQQ